MCACAVGVWCVCVCVDFGTGATLTLHVELTNVNDDVKTNVHAAAHDQASLVGLA